MGTKEGKNNSRYPAKLCGLSWAGQGGISNPFSSWVGKQWEEGKEKGTPKIFRSPREKGERSDLDEAIDAVGPSPLLIPKEEENAGGTHRKRGTILRTFCFSP